MATANLLLGTATLNGRAKLPITSPSNWCGSLNRLRNQLAIWQVAGLVASEATTRQIAKGMELLARAATGRADPLVADEEAQRSLEVSLAATASLGREYAEQSLAARRKHASKSTTLMGVSLGTSAQPESVLRPLVGTINTGTVPLSWREVEKQEGRRDWTLSDRQIEWCRSKGLKICAGPLLQLDRCAARTGFTCGKASSTTSLRSPPTTCAWP